MKNVEFELINIESKIRLTENKLKSCLKSMKYTIDNIERRLDNNEGDHLNSCGEFQDTPRFADLYISNLQELYSMRSSLKRILEKE